MKTKRLDPELEEVSLHLIAQWRRLHKLTGPADSLQTREFRSVVKGIKFFLEEELNNEDYFANKDLLGAYLLYQWPIHYQEALSLMSELPTTPSRVLDVCSGPAPFSFAAHKMGAREIIAVDRSQFALDLGAEVCGRYGIPITVRKWDSRSGAIPAEGKFDLIILAHALEELFPRGTNAWPEKELQFVMSLINKLTPNGYLMLVESSLPKSNTRFLALRDKLVEQKIPVQAPCVWQGRCPALRANDNCYAQREVEKTFLMKEIQRSGRFNQGSLKMSYLILRNPVAGWPELPPNPLYRVISPPVEGRREKEFYLCGTDGKKRLASLLPEQTKDTKAFDYLRRGELIAVENAETAYHTIDLVVGSKITVEAPCGKPLPSYFNSKPINP